MNTWNYIGLCTRIKIIYLVPVTVKYLLGYKEGSARHPWRLLGPRCGEGWSAFQRRVYNAEVWNPVNALSGTTFQHRHSVLLYVRCMPARLPACPPAAEFLLLMADPIHWLCSSIYTNRNPKSVAHCTEERPTERCIKVNGFSTVCSLFCIKRVSIYHEMKRR